jgi:hypothetical protein
MPAIDWSALEEYFIERTPPTMTLRDFADLTSRLKETNYSSIGYSVLREYAQANKWLSLRAKYYLDENPELYGDVEVIYGMLLSRFVDKYEGLSGTELAQLSREIRSLLDIRMQQQMILSTEEPDDVDRVTRDELIDEMNKSIKGLPQSAAMYLAKESVRISDEPG